MFLKQFKHYNYSDSHMEQSTLNFIYFLACIGGLVFIIWISKLLWTLIKAIIPSKNFKERYGAKSWAVVTGASDGIGLGFCEQLAALGFNICMIARNRDKMQKALKQIVDLNVDKQIQTRVIVADFTQTQKQGFFNAIFRQLEGIDISILVNNVGISNIGYFHEITEKRLKDEINVNILAMTFMSYHIIPLMMKREKRSAIINLASVAAQNPIPFIATYSATKAYNDFFSQSIQMEYRQKIDILSLKPMYVQSNMSKMKKSCTVASKNQCAQSAIKYLGIDYQTNGYYMHRFLSYITSLIPTPILRCIAQSESRKLMEDEKKIDK